MDQTIQHQLIDECRRNNRKAQLQLYRQYCDGMFRVAHRLLGNVQDAEDAMQEAFINAFQKIGQYSGEVTFGAWLKKIVVNKCLDLIRSRKKLPELQEELPELPMENDTNWEVDDSVTLSAIKKAIQVLPDKYRFVVTLYLIEGYNHEEIAQILDISVIASRTQLRRGKQKVKSYLVNQSANNKSRHYGSGY